MGDIGNELFSQIRFFFKIVHPQVGIVEVALQGHLHKFNLLHFNMMIRLVLLTEAKLLDHLKARGILAGGYGRLRLVTHHDFAASDIPAVVEAVKAFCAA